jgi:hypothetical protein
LTRLLSQHPPLPRVWCCRQELCHQWLYTCIAYARDAWRAWRQDLIVSSSDILAAAAAVFKLFWHTCCCSCCVHTCTRYYSYTSECGVCVCVCLCLFVCVCVQASHTSSSLRPHTLVAQDRIH